MLVNKAKEECILNFGREVFMRQMNTRKLFMAHSLQGEKIIGKF